MTTESKRIVVASVLIFIVLLVQPYYLSWLGISDDHNSLDINDQLIVEQNSEERQSPPKSSKDNVNSFLPDNSIKLESYSISTPLYILELGNNAGGTIFSASFLGVDQNDSRLTGGLDRHGVYQYDSPVLLAPLDDKVCAPCLAYYDYNLDEYIYFNMPFNLITPVGSNTITLSDNDRFEMAFVYKSDELLITKTLTFSGNSYVVNIAYSVEGSVASNYPFEVFWSGGLQPTERLEMEDITNGYGMVAQGDERIDINISSADENIERTVYNGVSNWVAVRNKYFISSLIPKTPSSFSTLSANSVEFGNRSITPLYNMSIGYNNNINNILTDLYFGPLDIDYIKQVETNLDSSMNFGFSIIRPIGKFVLFVLKFLHNTLKLNYGIALIVFAFLVWFITRPLTKKSFESSKKMQQVTPLIKKVQEKYKDNPQKMNQEVMKLYKENGANPLGGCLPMLLQMPLLWSLFVVFRSTIEFRGAEFVFWINDLSQPDVLFYLPFHIPLYGSHVALLPILMGISIFMTQRISMATMDPNQKPVMYIMNGFFILIFNSFPSGLNLYYTVYNLLNYYQQKSINTPKNNIK